MAIFNIMWFWIFAFLEIILDQTSKFLILKNLSLGESFALINPVVYIHYIQNKGAAFGILPNFGGFFMIIASLVLALFIFFQKKILKLPKSLQVSLGFIFGGTFGNLIDRIRFGYVIDFIDLKFWPVFNLADTALTVSIIYLAIYLLKKGEHKEIECIL